MSDLVLVAVDVRSSYNVGSLFRSADGFGANLVLVGITPRPNNGIDDDRLPYIADKAHSRISKTALGAEDTVKWQYFTNLEDAVIYLEQENYTVVALEQCSHSLPLRTIPKFKKIAVVLGREVVGLSEAELVLMHSTYEIPMVGFKESFNVSVAGAIALYQITENSLPKL